MQLMSNVTLDKRISVETTARAEFGLEKAYALAKLHGLEWPGPKGMTKGAVASAFWLWLADQDEDVILEILGTYLPRLEAIVRDAGAPPKTSRAKSKGKARRERKPKGHFKPASGAVLETEPDRADPATHSDHTPSRRT